MKKIDQVSKIIDETDDLQMLIEHLLMCFDGINDDQRREFMRKIAPKIEEVKSKRKKPSASFRKSVHSQRLTAMGQMAAAISRCSFRSSTIKIDSPLPLYAFTSRVETGRSTSSRTAGKYSSIFVPSLRLL